MPKFIQGENGGLQVAFLPKPEPAMVMIKQKHLNVMENLIESAEKQVRYIAMMFGLTPEEAVQVQQKLVAMGYLTQERT